jgi:hypothetical protein
LKGETVENQKPQVINDRCWIAEDGSQGQCDVVIFDESNLTSDQWEIFNELPESQTFNFVKAVINGEDLSQWKEMVA